MASNDKSNKKPAPAQGYVINEQGEEVPITDEMVTRAMRDIKLQSIGAHTGFTKAITDEMISDYKKERENS